MTIRTYLVVTGMKGHHRMGRSPVPLTRKPEGLIIRRGGILNRDPSLGGRVKRGGGLKATFMSHIKHDSLEATYLSGGRHFWMG